MYYSVLLKIWQQRCFIEVCFEVTNHYTVFHERKITGTKHTVEDELFESSVWELPPCEEKRNTNSPNTLGSTRSAGSCLEPGTRRYEGSTLSIISLFHGSWTGSRAGKAAGELDPYSSPGTCWQLRAGLNQSPGPWSRAVGAPGSLDGGVQGHHSPQRPDI